MTGPHHAPLGARVRTAREAAGLSMRKLAETARVDVAQISRIESGGGARAETVAALAGALGTTIDALLGVETPAEANAVRTARHDHISAGGANPRRTFHAESVAELADSIREHGLLQPLTVKPAPDAADEWIVVAGERRWRAIAELIGRGDLPPDWPVPVVVRDVGTEDHLILALIENIQREDMSPLGEASAFQTLIEAGRTTAGIAQAVGKTERHIHCASPSSSN